MAVDGGYGAKGRPKFDPAGAFEDWVDLEAVGTFAGDVGNRKVGTAARRAALSSSTTASDQLWDGLEFFETDTGKTYLRDGTTWLNVTPPNVNRTFPLAGAASVSMQLQLRAFHGVTTLGTSGVGEFVYPGGAFPNAVMAAIVQFADADSYRGWNANLRNETVQTLDRVRFIVTDAAGASVPSGTAVPVSVIAVGF